MNKLIYTIVLSAFWGQSFALSCKCVPAITDSIWKEVPVPTKFMEETLLFFEAKFTEPQKYITPSQMKMYEHIVSNSNYAFAYYTEPFISSHPGHYMAIRMADEYKTIRDFDEFVDSVFSVLPADSADDALFLIESFATFLFHYPETEAMCRYETDEFVAIWRTYKKEEYFSLKSPRLDLDSYGVLAQDVKQSLVEKWQMSAYGKTCEYTYCKLCDEIGLLESFCENNSAYTLCFGNTKPHLLELSDSTPYISIHNTLNRKEYTLENLTYLFIVMEIIKSSSVPTNREKYEVIRKIKTMREELGLKSPV